MWEPEIHPLIFQYGESALVIGLIREASDYFSDLTEKCVRIVGPDAEETLYARWLSALSKASLDPQGALRMTEELLEDQIRIFGEPSEETLFTRWQLVLLRVAAGDHARVVAEADQLLPLMDTSEQVGSALSISLASARARSLGELGDPRPALAELEEVIHKEEKSSVKLTQTLCMRDL